jgi:hypothetical protein
MRSILVVLLAACSAPARAPARAPAIAPAQAPQPPQPAARAPTSPEATAGLYWIPYTTCDDCAAPTALVAYVTQDEARARRVTATLDGRLALGMPWVIHTDQLDDGGTRIVVADPGIAIVIGSFATPAAAKSAADRAPAIDGVHARVIDLASSERADSLGEEAQLVTVVDRGAPVAAWSARDIEAVSNRLDSGEYEGTREQALARELAKHRPACTVQPGQLFEARAKDLRWYEFAPVRCGRNRAYIPWTASLLGHAVIVRGKSGDRLFQIVGAACDSPDIREWTYDEHGRHSAPAATVVASTDC